MTNDAENRIQLFEEVKELREKEKKHCDCVWTVKEEKQLAEADWIRLTRPLRKAKPLGRPRGILGRRTRTTLKWLSPASSSPSLMLRPKLPVSRLI